MVTDRIQKILNIKSHQHREDLKRLGKLAEETALSPNVLVMPQKPQIVGIHSLLMDPFTSRQDFVFYFDRICALLMEESLQCMRFDAATVTTPQETTYQGLKPHGEVSAVVVLRGGTVLEKGLKRVIPDCRTGRILIQTNYRTGEPELHYHVLPKGIETHERVLIMDAQMSSGGAALMAVRVLVDHGVPERNIVFVTYTAGRLGLNRLMQVFPEIRVVVGRLVKDYEERWVELKYLGC